LFKCRQHRLQRRLEEFLKSKGLLERYSSGEPTDAEAARANAIAAYAELKNKGLELPPFVDFEGLKLYHQRLVSSVDFCHKLTAPVGFAA
jgi:hypothetical protein